MNILDVSLAILTWVAPTSPVHACPKSKDGWRSILFRWGNGLRCLVGRTWSMLCYWRCLEQNFQKGLWQCTARSSELSHSRNRDISSVQEMYFFQSSVSSIRMEDPDDCRLHFVPLFILSKMTPWRHAIKLVCFSQWMLMKLSTILENQELLCFIF